ncbi:MAG: response regulator, partial [Desulfobulbaceae bacterium]|nr:response regulator [Desulfobulbaceae bacterium]
MTAETSLQDINDFDPHFKIFHELMVFKVREILLVSSPYDAYIMEEDGSMASKIINEYQGLNLSQPPRITRVATGEQALELLKEKKFDMVVTMPHLGGMDGCTFGTRVKEYQDNIPVILLAHSVRDAVVQVSEGPYPCIDNIYVWCCDSDILLAIVKNVEDQRNVDFDTGKAMVRVILLVEDSAIYRSSLLPILYGEVVQQTQSVLDEGLNEKHRLLKMRARPKILTAASFEEAMELFTRYRPYIFSVMSDVRFPKAGKIKDNAGLELLREIRKHAKDLPLLVLSTESKNKQRAEAIPAVFVNKTSSTIREQIHDFFLRYLGFGDFVFRMPDGKQVGRASSLHAFEKLISTVPVESLMYHAGHNHFSNWVMARAEVALAARLHKQHFVKITSGEDLREDIVAKIHVLRKLRQQGVVSQFAGDDYDPQVTDFVRIGRGSMGGKARGIAFIATRLQRGACRALALKKNKVKIPTTCVIAIDGFDDFVRSNDLFLQEDETDESIAGRFLAAHLPGWLFDDLRAFLMKIECPLSIRSSSMLEDAQFRPYAGLYKTYMLVNGDADFEVRLQQLVQAVKLVYASTWFENPRACSRSIGQSREDSMAVIIQQLVGGRYEDNIYPAIAGVAQSYNYYPIEPMRSEDGIAHVALGFGRTVVEGEQSMRFSPAFPKNLPQFSTVDDILTNAQRWFYSLNCSDSEKFEPEYGNLVRRELDDATGEYPVQLLCSTYSVEEHRIRDADLPGHKILTFASVLKYGLYPLPEILSELLVLGREGMGCEVEIEFAVDLKENLAKSVFYFLQIRPIVTGSEMRRVRITAPESKTSFIRSQR